MPRDSELAVMARRLELSEFIRFMTELLSDGD